MASRVPLIFVSSLLILLFGYAAAANSSVPQIPIKYDTVFLNRSSFPAGFIFGTASSAYQYEGAWKEGGKGPSMWDNYTHQHPERITNSSYGTNADVTNDEYHRYKEDVQIMKRMNTDAYRFSISWSRLLPNGKLSGGVNHEGVKYYNNLINELLANGLKPFVTIFHWDVPQALEEEFGGFLSPKIVPYYKDYAELCFKLFGDRVKHWITLNEPYIFSLSGYAMGTFAPGRCSAWQNLNCTGGDSGTEPYLVGHYLLLSHAAAVRVYKRKYQKAQNGVIGITLISHWYVPLSSATHHQNAAKRALDFMFGWFMDPLTNGDYPHVMRSLVRKRLPVFKKYESELLKGSFDFIGINYYTTYYSAYGRNDNPLQPSMLTDPHTNNTSDRNGVPIGPQGGSGWLNIYPKGIRDLLVYTKKKYNNPLIYITENGVDQADHDDLSLEKALIDNQRIEYYFSHLNYLWKAIKEGVNVKGYFAWSLLDNFEWSSGYTSRFGINYVDFKNGQKRYPKLSAHWFTKFLKN